MPHPYALNVIAVISNPIGYKSRYRLYKQFEKIIRQSDINLITVELVLDDQPFAVTDPTHPNHVQLRAGPESVLWVKESLINIGIAHLTKNNPNWKYVAWIDADVEFVNPNWASDTIDALQKYKVVQPWSHAVDLGPKDEIIGTATSLSYCYNTEPDAADRVNPPPKPKYATTTPTNPSNSYWHAGYAWAMRREVWDGIQALIDWCPMGAADHHMAWAFLGNISRGVHGHMGKSYKQKARQFQALCAEYVNKSVGYVPGTLLHRWHGKKRNRFYVERWAALVENDFDPELDLTHNEDGLIVQTDRNPKLKQALYDYLRSRDEDSMEME